MRRKVRPEHRLGILIAALLFFFPGGFARGAFASNLHAWPHATFYTVVVRPGDSIVKLAARYDIPASDVATLNRLAIGSKIHPGQVLRIPAATPATSRAVLSEALDRGLRNYAPPPRSVAEVRKILVPINVSVRESPPAIMRRPLLAGDQPSASDHGPRFRWPIMGPLVSRFGVYGEGERNDGINIAAESGAPIHAAASGTVSYAGSAIKAYGNLILIAHEDGYVTAYAHAGSIAVGRGDRVVQGQVIGTAGETGNVDRPQLHFEIRRGARPINPGLLLAARP